jgi:hypothetical protein
MRTGLGPTARAIRAAAVDLLVASTVLEDQAAARLGEPRRPG